MAFIGFPSAMLLLSLIVIVSATTEGGHAPAPAPTPQAHYKKPHPREGYGNNTNPNASKIIGVQGVIYCKLGLKLIPLQGAKARITCLTEDKNGYESAPFSIISQVADKKGYFLATFSLSELKEDSKISECKAYVENSPWEGCKVPTDVNSGISGALLYSYRRLTTKDMKLYSVGPFFYTPEL